MNFTPYIENLIAHYEKEWDNKSIIKYFGKGPIEDLLPQGFCVLEFPPTSKRNLWTYATCCMSTDMDINPIELHIFSSTKNSELVELLTVIAHYHITGEKLNLNQTVNFGKPWQNNSNCNYGLISLPYLDGPKIENCIFLDKTIKCFWLIPITKEELNYVKNLGIDALEELFEKSNFKYYDENRKSII